MTAPGSRIPGWSASPRRFSTARCRSRTRSPASARTCDVAAADLLAVPKGTISEAGLRQNLNVGVGYIEAWLRGSGCVPLYHLMEDAATAEISRAQVWQWIRHGARLDDGRTIDAALCRAMLDEETAKLRELAGEAAYRHGRYEDAARLFRELIEAPEFPEFLTIPAYDMIVAEGA